MVNPSTKISLAAAVALALFTAPQTLVAEQNSNTPWQAEMTSDGTSISPRHETGSVVVGGNLYVLGGRRAPPVEVYRPATDGWQNLGAAPTDLHHFQPVAIGSKIYIIGAMTCCFPDEPSVAEIHVFNTANDNWSIEGQMPANRLRGGGGAVVYQNKIYVIGGNTQGHSGGAVSWFDEYNPANGTWKTLPDAPTARDHFQAVIIGNELVVTGGRQTDFPNPFRNTVAQTNIYNFDTGQWRVGASIPTQRAGSPAVGVGGEVLVMGGEASGQTAAFDTVEAYDVGSNSWRTLRPMIEGRHSGASGIIGNRLHMIGGSAGIGGGPEIRSHESLLLNDVMGAPEVEEPEQEPVEEPIEEPVVEQPPEEPVVEQPPEQPEEEPVAEEEPTDEVEAESPEEEVTEEEPTDEAPAEQPITIIDPDTDTDSDDSSEQAADEAAQEQQAVAATGDPIGESADVFSSESSGGGGFFGASSWPLIVMFGGLLIGRRRVRH